jgi:FtsH-binding integral membrane protein
MSQDSGFGVAYKAPNMVSLGDIYDAIEGDRSMTSIERQLLVKAIKDATGNASESSRVSSLMSGAVGAILGQLVAKYFGGGVIGRALGAALGFGAGRSLYGAMTKKDPLPGYRVLA